MIRSRALACVLLLCGATCAWGDTQLWSATKAHAWYAQQRWLVGANYIPADAINQLEMWQAETFNIAQIDKELGWAAAAGMNTMRVYLHDKLWEQDAAGFTRRIEAFLAVAAKHGIKPMLVLFDSCWDDAPALGPQRAPVPGVHNSGWVQSPGRAGLADPANYPRLAAYARGVVAAFANDPRVLAWDVWNEPDNGAKPGDDKFRQVAALLPQVFAWVRSADPSQPVTSGLWQGADWSTAGALNAIQKVQLEQSDVITFHVYDWPEVLERRIRELQPYGRPLLCTEYLARSVGSTFDTALPIARRFNVGMIHWGLVAGRTQTIYPWDSLQRPYTDAQPGAWFHDVFHPDGRPYRQSEIDLIRGLTAAAQAEFAKKRAVKR
jgi:hypothetical protein